MATNPQHVNPMECLEISLECPVEASIYGYYPSLGANAFFVAVFVLCFLVNSYLGYRYRTWTYMAAMTLASLANALGYAGRVMLHSNPFDTVGFQIQICCLTLAPAFNSAAIYLTLKHIVRKVGREASRLRPKYYTWIFISADFLALVLQAAGGAIAATANDNESLRSVGDSLMISGISWQVVTLFIFGVMTTDFIIRRWRSGTPLSAEARATCESQNFRIFAGALLVIYLSILTRCVYRIAEMAGGWRNGIMQDETLFIGVDSCLVALATLLQTFVHPGHFFPALAEKKERVLSEEKNLSESSIEQSNV